MHAPGGDQAGGREPAGVIGIGASAGGVEALTALAGELPATFGAAIVVVLHVSPAGTSVLAQILDRAGPLPAVTAEDGMPLLAGRIHVAPPDRHVLVEDDRLRLSAGPRENGHRPAVDPTFRTLAALGPRAVGVVLSGTRDDGTQGAVFLRRAGGRVFVQDPAEATYDGMVRSVLRHVAVDAALPLRELASHLVHLTTARAEPMSDHDQQPAGEDAARESTRFTCPECGGHLGREHDAGFVRYSCEVGHAYSAESLDDEQATVVESALWTAARLLDDRAVLLEELAARAAAGGHERSASGFRASAEEARGSGRAVRALLEDGRVAAASEGRAA